MHARMSVGDKMLMASDAPPDRYEAMKGIMVTLGIDDPGEAERVFHALSEKGRCRCRFKRPFGPPALACSWINSARREMVNCEKAA
jgi:PhnB protein